MILRMSCAMVIPDLIGNPVFGFFLILDSRFRGNDIKPSLRLKALYSPSSPMALPSLS